ncbi:MAG: glycosyltransferase family 1 protein, partial [Negativicutes bacterium]|nr:glycosyltransferase family 1 protein [Negativicutes bacterium]
MNKNFKVAIFEQIVTSGGHEIEFDRIIVDELRGLGCDVFFYVPEGHRFSYDYRVNVRPLSGSGVNYQGTGKVGRWFRSV